MGRHKKIETALPAPAPPVETVPPTKVRLLRALVVGMEVKERGAVVSIAILEKFGVDVGQLRERGIVK